MQHGSARGVWRALPPIALGHAAAVGVVLLAAALAGLVVPLDALRVIVALMLMTLGLYRLWRHRHPRYGGMQVGFRDLTVVVVSHGVGAWRRIHGAAVRDADASRAVGSQPRARVARGRRRRERARRPARPPSAFTRWPISP